MVGPSLAGLWPLRSSTDSSAVMHYITVLIFVRAMNKSGILGSFLDKIENRHNNTCVCMVRHVASVRINRVRLLKFCLWSIDQGKCRFPCHRSHLRIWSRETVSAVPSRVSLLISILRLNLVLTYEIPSEFRGGVHLFMYHTVYTPLDMQKPPLANLFALENNHV